MNKRLLVAIPVGLLVLIQLVPYRVNNPPVQQGPSWDSPATEALARKACFDCHSNEVRVPWYGYIAPTAWAVRYHVDEAREALNFSELNLPQKEVHEAVKMVRKAYMPPDYYLTLHSEANLSDDERTTLAKGLKITLAPFVKKHHEEDDD